MPNKILITSLGSIGKRHLRNIKHLLKDCEISVLRRKNSISDTVNHQFHTLKDAIKFNPDCIVIASPAPFHMKQFLAFNKLNKPVFIEKPLSRTLDELKKFNISNNTFSMVGYILRFHPTLNKIKKIIDAETYGKVLCADIEVGQFLPDWRPQSDYRKGVSAIKKLGGGVLLELSHEIDYATWLFGNPISLFCSSRKLSNLDLDVEDYANLIFEYGDKNVSIHLDFLQRKPQMIFKIVFEQGTVIADLIRNELILKSPAGKDRLIRHISRKDSNEDYIRQFDFLFYKSLKGYKPAFSETKKFKNYCTFDQAKNTMNIIDIAKKSNSEGKRIFLKGKKL